MNKRQVNSVKTAIQNTRNAIKGNGFYMPSDAQTAALKALYGIAARFLGKREALRFKLYLMELDTANRNEVYTICATERQIAAVEKALNMWLNI